MSPIAGHIAKVLPDWIVAVTRYGRSHRAIPNLLRPRTFNEKVLHRILFDRSTWMPMVADKYRVRDYVCERVGPQILPELYWVTSDPDSIPFDALPERFVVKPTHGSGWVEIVHDKRRLDRARLLEMCRSWLGRSYYEVTREWIYKDITPRILVEEFIDDGSGASPNDYKLLVFGGRVEFILVTMGRFETRAHLLVDRDWKPVDVKIAYSKARRMVAPPPHLREMIEVAETLARGMDFVRADFYDTEQKLFFGELTATPGCAVDRFEPASFDSYLGSLWKRERAA
jgi:teichuronopeptide biosynthesis TupA-like protein